MADMNYVSPLTSDLTDYYTKSEVDELQQGDAATYATSAEIVAGDNAVKGWVVSQGFLTEHQDLTNYATISYVDDAIAAIEPSSGGMAVRVVNTLPAVGEENVLYLVFVDNEDEDNRYAEYVWVDTLNDYEMLGFSSSEGGIIPDLTDYATKQWVEAKGYLDSSALTGYATVSDLADFATKDYVDGELANKANAADLAAVATSGSYNDLTDKPTIPAAPDLTPYATKQELTAKADAASLASVATTGDYDDLTNKPTIPVLPTLATVATSGSYNDLSDKPTISSGGIEGTADGGLAFIYPELLDNSVRKGYVIWSDTPQDELIGWLKSGYWIRLMNSSCQSDIPISSFGNYNRVFIYTLNKDTGVITSQYYQSGTLSFYGNGWVVRVLPNAFLWIPCTNASTQDTETLNAIKKMRENYLLNYDNTTSGLSATTIQGAIDELAAASGGGSEVGWSYDSSTGYMTFTGMSDNNL